MLSSEFLEANYDRIFDNYQSLLNSENYVTRRQALKVSFHLSCFNTPSNIQILLGTIEKEMVNVSKREQQPDHRTDNSRRPPIGLQCSEKLPHSEVSFSWPLNKYNIHSWHLTSKILLYLSHYTCMLFKQAFTEIKYFSFIFLV